MAENPNTAAGRAPEIVIRLKRRVSKATPGGDSNLFSELVSTDAIAQLLCGKVRILRAPWYPRDFRYVNRIPAARPDPSHVPGVRECAYR
jgi:hypothetical protein